MPSLVAFNARGGSVAGLKAAQVKSDGEKQVTLAVWEAVGVSCLLLACFFDLRFSLGAYFLLFTI